MNPNDFVTLKHSSRVEDERLLRGEGRYMSDAPLPNQAYACFVRSPHGAADIRSIDTTSAARLPGVIAILTGKDMEAAGVRSLSQHSPLKGRDGQPLREPFRPALATQRVVHCGEAVALVVCNDPLIAQDAAEQIVVDYEPRDAVTDIHAAVAYGAPLVWPDLETNVAIDWPGLADNPVENAEKVDRIISSAKFVARVSLKQQRLHIAPMEPRGATAIYDDASGIYTLRVCSQGARAMRDALADMMGIRTDRIRVMTEDVGGAFGVKISPYPEYLALLVAAKECGRPVHWMSGRSEAFLTDCHARDAYSDVELAVDENGKFQALRIRHLGNMGAYIGPFGANIQTVYMARCLPGMYDIPHIDMATRCVFTNTTPTAPYRGAGRPEASYCLERVVDEAARITGIDPIALRCRNFVNPKSFPYRTAVGTVYDTGDFAGVLDTALSIAGHASFPSRKSEAKRQGKLRGFGLCCVLEHSGGSPVEGALITFPGDSKIGLTLNVQSTGQGHATVFPRLAAQRLGIDPAIIIHAQGDSAHEIEGYAAVGSRTAMTAGHAVIKAVDEVIAKGKRAASIALEASEGDLVYEAGEFIVAGTDRRISLLDLADQAVAMAEHGDIAESLDTKTSAETPLTFPNGCHIAEVEIDPETGNVTLLNYCSVDDCGNILDRSIVEGQVHGAIAMGIGQALLEHAVYDSEGQLIAGSFMDYGMPRAHHLPRFEDHFQPVPSSTNPLGVKGIGEAGTTAAISAVMNAIADAIPGVEGRSIDMPATPEKVWRACLEAFETQSLGAASDGIITENLASSP